VPLPGAPKQLTDKRFRCVWQTDAAVSFIDRHQRDPFFLYLAYFTPHDALFWRWRSQAAVRADHWKLILLGRNECFLFDLDSPEGETKNRIADFPAIAAKLDQQLMVWNATLPPPGLPRDLVGQDQRFFDDHVNKTGSAATRRPGNGTRATLPAAAADWVARGASAMVKEGVLLVTPDAKGRQSFVAFTNLAIPGPAVANV
jgi:hypothetical protein